MTGQAGEKPKRETWRDWQPADAPAPPLLTRAEVLALLERWGTTPPVDERILRYWEARGLVPRPTRTYHAGATRTRYPSWVADLCASIRLWQRVGRTLADIAGRVRAEAARLARNPRPHPFPAAPAQPNPFADFLRQSPHWREFMESWQAIVDRPRFPPLPNADPPTLPETAAFLVVDALRWAMQQQYDAHRFKTERVEVRLIDAAGAARVYHVPLPDWLALDRAGDALAGLTPPDPPEDDTGTD